jgi:NADH dehydrogenase FAD-containing subunit
MKGPLDSAELAKLAKRFEQAHRESNISALAILCVEAFPIILDQLRHDVAQQARKDAA